MQWAILREISIAKDTTTDHHYWRQRMFSMFSMYKKAKNFDLYWTWDSEYFIYFINTHLFHWSDEGMDSQVFIHRVLSQYTWDQFSVGFGVTMEPLVRKTFLFIIGLVIRSSKFNVIHNHRIDQLIFIHVVQMRRFFFQLQDFCFKLIFVHCVSKVSDKT